MTAPTCATCRFFDGTLECRRFPPTPLWDGRWEKIRYLHPDVDPDHWCGEHAPHRTLVEVIEREIRDSPAAGALKVFDGAPAPKGEA